MSTVALTKISLYKLTVYSVNYLEMKCRTIIVLDLTQVKNLIDFIFQFGAFYVNREASEVLLHESRLS